MGKILPSVKNLKVSFFGPLVRSRPNALHPNPNPNPNHNPNPNPNPNPDPTLALA